MHKTNFLCNFQSDLFKVSKLKSIFVALILIFVLALLVYSVVWIGVNVIDLAPTESAEDTISKEEGIMQLKMMSNTYLYSSVSLCSIELFTAIICCIFIGKDFSSGGIALAVARGQQRRNIYFSKLLVMCLLVVAYSAISLLLCGIFTAITGYEGAFTGRDFAMLMRNFFMQILCGISSASIFVMIAFLCRSAGSSLATSIGAFVLLGIVSGIIALVVGVTTNNGGDAWMYYLPMSQMDVAASYGKWSTNQIVSVSVMPIVYTAISTAIGYLSFEKRDIK